LKLPNLEMTSNSEDGLIRALFTFAAPLVFGTSLAAQAINPWLCKTKPRTTNETFLALCPIEGACDVPANRDEYLLTTSTPIRWLRLHLIVFRDDNGNDPAETPADIDAQMATVNQDYLPYRIQFTYTWEYVDDSTYRYSGIPSDEMKLLYNRNPGRQCNIYVTNLGGGIGTFPWDPNAITALGGVIVGRNYFSGSHHILTHELGHNLGLWHTHHGVEEVIQCSPCYERADGVNGDVTGDFADDTPPEPSDFGNCNPIGGSDSCTSTAWGDTQRENYMSYGSLDGVTCWNLFTPKQAARMHCWSSAVLGSWLDCNVGNDCNNNLNQDYCDIIDGVSLDTNGNSIPDECEAVVATATPYNGTGVNLDALNSSTVVIGASWNVDLTPQAGRAAGTWLILVRASDAVGQVYDLGSALGLPAAGASEILVDPMAYITNFSPAPHSGGGSTSMFSAPVPNNFGLVGNPWYAQAVVFGDLPAGGSPLDPWFSSAVGGIIGTF